MHSKTLFTAVLALAAAGCASTPCDLDEPYHRAVAYPYLKDGPGVAAPEPTDEFRIPQAPESVEFAKDDTSGDEHACLEVPAPLPEFETAPAQPEEPAETEQG